MQLAISYIGLPMRRSHVVRTDGQDVRCLSHSEHVDYHLLSTYSGVGKGFGVVLYSLTGSTSGKAVKRRVIALLHLVFVLLKIHSPVDLPHHPFRTLPK